ncbi:uncharacterized protein LOC135705049 [Ochlerotatus camptorhynchus]|uniref:uncharacterized protein LOC135705049 n=1 Tax=Ochlerotatus camptorhynchus TaxID=644619 RepID=UPI0031DCF853
MSVSSSQSSPSPPKSLLDLGLEDKQRFLDSFDYVLTDCDGVVWNLYGPIDGVGEAISALKGTGKHLVYVSNNSVRTLGNYKEQVRKLGHEVDEADVIHPVVSVIQYLKSINFQGLIYAICAEPFLAALRDAGYEVLHGPTEPMPEALRLIIPVIHDKKPVKAVIVDYDFNCSHTKLLRAELYLKTNPECMLIAGATDRSISITQQLEVIGSGHYVDILEKATGREAIVLGKPGHQLAKQLKEQYGMKDAKRVLFVGDMIAQDVAFGKVAGFQTLLVLTGGAKKLDVERLSNQDHVPDYYTESFADFGKLIQEVLEAKGKASL